ncbi:MAG: LysM peptidoglycan-binding domain-containing protein [Anaerolineales bacterium]
MKSLKKVAFILMVSALLMTQVAAIAPTAYAANQPVVPANCTRLHTVQKNETLTKIGRLYGTTARALITMNQIEEPGRIKPGMILCVAQPAVAVPAVPVLGADTSTSVRVSATQVHEDKDVTLSGKNLANNSRYSVYMVRYGKDNSLAVPAGFVTTNSSGAFTSTVRLPKKMVDVAKITVILRNSSGDIASNWFINADSSGNTGGKNAPSFNISVSDVEKGDWVQIKTSNLPANVTFSVRIGAQGSKGEKGILVGTLRDDDGSVKATFDIPAELADRSKLDIRVENTALGIYAYATFQNTK